MTLISVKRTGQIATITLKRPKVHNAINVEMYRKLPEILKSLDEDSEVKVVILRGAGKSSFSAGADIKEFEKERSNADLAKNYNKSVAAAEHAMDLVSKPLIAMIHGYCVGGGAGLAVSCDIRFADMNAKFAITPAKLGLVYSLESTKRVVDLVGPSRARWILMSGLPIESERAVELGLFDEVKEENDLENYTYEFASILCERAQYSVRSSKKFVRRIISGQVADDDETTRIRDDSFITDDYMEGVQAFMEKRKPTFRWS